MIRHAFFWCGNVMLLQQLYKSIIPSAISITILDERIEDKDFTYKVYVDNKIYYYRFTLSSNTKCVGSFFIEAEDWKSKVYSFSKQADNIHINETSIDYHDLYMYSDSCLLDVHINGGRKQSISTFSVLPSKRNISVRYINLPITKIQDKHSVIALRDIFSISGTVNQIKQTINDAVSYDGPVLSLVSYSDHPIQIIGIDTLAKDKKNATLQCMNSFFRQRFEFHKVDDRQWLVEEYASGMDDVLCRRKYEIVISDDLIVVPDRKLSFSYTVDDGNLVFRRQ